MFRTLLVLAFGISTLTPAVAQAADEAAPDAAASSAITEDAAGKAPAKKGKSGGSAKKSSGKKSGGTEKAPAKKAPAPAGKTAQPRAADSQKATVQKPASTASRSVPVTHKVQTGSAASQTARVGGTSSGVRVNSGHTTANFRTSSSRSQGIQVHHSVAEHRAVSRHAHNVAVAHHNVAVAHHRAAFAANHRAWRAYHHPYSWGHPRAYWRPWAPGHPHYWYHGVVVYGPPPAYRGQAPGAEVEPERTVEREDTFAIGVRGGSYMSHYDNGAAYGDMGLGLALRYRPVEPLGLELSWTYHDQTWSGETERIQQPISASAELFAFSWTKFNPYVLAGLTLTSRNVQDEVGGVFVDSNQSYLGPHGGLGLEVGLGDNMSVNADARWIGYVNHGQADLAYPGALQANLGLNYYF